MRKKRIRRRRRRKPPSVTTLQRQQLGAGFGVLLKTLPRVLRSFGPTLKSLTRGVRGVNRSGLSRLTRTVPKAARGLTKTVKRAATKKNLKRLGKAGAIAAATGAVTGAAQHGVRRVLSRKNDRE